MIFIVTSNLIDVSSIKDIQDGYVISLLRDSKNLVMVSNPTVYQYHLYSQGDMMLSDIYQSDETLRFQFDTVSSFSEVIEEISRQIYEKEKSELSKDEDVREDITVIVCCNYPWNRQMVRALNQELSDIGSDIECLDLYKYLKVGSMDRMVQGLKGMLNTDHVYPDDPVAFSYALYQVVGGII